MTEKHNKKHLSHAEAPFGISPVVFRDALQSGLEAYKSTNEFHPKSAGGSRAWSDIVSTFRQFVINNYEGWHSIEQNSTPILVNPSKGISIVVSSGDNNTGLNNQIAPKSRNPKGIVAQNYIDTNYSLFDATSNSVPIDPNQTWIFQYVIDKVNKEIRYELSLPISYETAGSKGKIKVSEWKDRVLFPALPFESIIDEPVPQFSDDSDFFDVVKK